MAINKFGKGGFDSADSSFQGLGSLSSISTFTIFGCTDSSAFNFNPGVNTDDGSCIPVITGCLDPLSPNFNDYDGDGVSNAITQDPFTDVNTDTIPTLCQYPGCTDSTAFNFDSNANFDDGSCIPVVEGCTDGSADTNISVFPDYSVDVTGVTASSINVTGPSTAANNYNYSLNTNYNSSANTDDGSCIQRIYGCMQPTMFNFEPLANTEPPGICHFPIFGCTTLASCNYDPNADSDTSPTSCTFCNTIGADNYSSSATCDTHCLFCEPSVIDTQQTTTGAITPTNANINLHWTQPSFPNSASIVTYTIRYKIAGSNGWTYITGVTGSSYNIQGLNENTDYSVKIRSRCTNSDTNYGQTSGLFTTPLSVIPGCTDSTQSNYNPLATIDDGSCIPCVDGCTDVTAINYNILATCDDGSCTVSVTGCTDPAAGNYDPFANVNDFSCTYSGCTDATAFNYSFTNSSPAVTANGDIYLSGIAFDDGSCVAVVNGCTNSAAFNYNAAANTDDGSCVAVVYGCIDVTALNFNSAANTDDGSCIGSAPGCTNSTAGNYDSSANVENGSCVFTGCADPYATNYAFDLLAQSPVNANENYIPHPTFAQNLIYLYPEAGTSTAISNGVNLSFGSLPLSVGNNTNNANVVSDQAVCQFPPLNGCTNASANNYHPDATNDDGSCCFGPSVNGSSGDLADGTPCFIGCTSPGYTNSSLLSSTLGLPNNISVFNNTSPYSTDASDGGCLNSTLAPVMTEVIYDNSTSATQLPSYFNNTGGTFNSSGQYRHGVEINISCGVSGNPSSDSTGCPDLTIGVVPQLGFANFDALNPVADNTTSNTRVFQSSQTTGIISTGWELWDNGNAGFVPSPNPAEITFISSGQSIGMSSKLNWDSLPASVANSIETNFGTGSGSTISSDGLAVDDASYTNTIQVTYKTGLESIVHIDTFDLNVGCTDYRANNYCPTCNTDIPVVDSQVGSSATSSTGLQTTSGANLCDYS